MAAKPAPLAWQPLQAEEISRLPGRIRLRLGREAEPDDDWLVLRTHGLEARRLVDRVNRVLALADEARAMPAGVPERDGATYLDRMLELLLANESVARWEVEAELLVDNLEMRMRYLGEVPTLTAADIHRASGSTSRNPSEPASRWKKEAKVFALRLGRTGRYPAFQFRDGAPLPAVRAVLAALPTPMTDWQKALWFASGNGWLDGDRPQDRLGDAELVVEAARRLADPVRG